MQLDKIEVSHGKGRLIITAVGYTDEEKAQALLAAMSKLSGSIVAPKAEEPIVNAAVSGLMDRSQVCEYLGFSKHWLHRKITKGLFVQPVIKGRGMKWRLEDIKAWIDGHVEKVAA